jgi:acyl-CoA reductase-like NAD-dependent aldehyde dehydrogenase
MQHCRAWHGELLEATQLETGFIRSDCEEVIEGVLAYVQDFPETLQSSQAAPLHYDCGPQKRRIRLVPTAWGTVAVVLPQSAFLILGVTCLLNALAAGNRVILRAPLQCARSAALLSEVLQAATAPQNAVSVVLTRGKEFTDALFRSSSPQLLHYMGSSRYASSLLSESFTHTKPSIIDGEGNVWVWVAEDADPDLVAQILTEGALRYNGQTCTSINGAVIHPALYAAVKERLAARWSQLKAGNPLTEDVHVGPLVDEDQSAWCERRTRESGGTVLCGGTREGNLLRPTLVEAPRWDSELVTEGLFGTALWIAPGDGEEFASRWQSNRYPLCAGVMSPAVDSRALADASFQCSTSLHQWRPQHRVHLRAMGRLPDQRSEPCLDLAAKVSTHCRYRRSGVIINDNHATYGTDIQVVFATILTLRCAHPIALPRWSKQHRYRSADFDCLVGCLEFSRCGVDFQHSHGVVLLPANDQPLSVWRQSKAARLFGRWHMFDQGQFPIGSNAVHHNRIVPAIGDVEPFPRRMCKNFCG